jgi:capsular exopolysaccharide synthesis family protein
MSVVSRWRRKRRDPAMPFLSAGAAEGYRELADNVLSLKTQRPIQTLAVASSVSGEGASTIAAGLAISLAENGAGEILLVDCNFRSPSLDRRLGVEGRPGLTDAVLADADPAEFTTPSGLPALTVMTSGNFRADSSRVLASDGFKTFLADMSHSYSLVILDSAPINGSRDTTILSTLVDGLLLVIQAERTNYEVIAKAQERIASGGGNIIGTALNRRRYHIPEALYRRL